VALATVGVAVAAVAADGVSMPMTVVGDGVGGDSAGGALAVSEGVAGGGDGAGGVLIDDTQLAILERTAALRSREREVRRTHAATRAAPTPHPRCSRARAPTRRRYARARARACA
jgi:hypothetical protein